MGLYIQSTHRNVSVLHGLHRIICRMGGNNHVILDDFSSPLAMCPLVSSQQGLLGKGASAALFNLCSLCHNLVDNLQLDGVKT